MAEPSFTVGATYTISREPREPVPLDHVARAAFFVLGVLYLAVRALAHLIGL